MPTRLKKRQKTILSALEKLGGTATTRQIAEKVHLNVNGVSQSLGALVYHNYAQCLGGEGGECLWKLENLSDTEAEIVKALKELCGTATTRAVAEQANLNITDTTQTLKALLERNYIRWLGDKSGDDRWELMRT